VNKKRYEKDAAGQDVLCEMPGLKNLGCAETLRQEPAETKT